MKSDRYKTFDEVQEDRIKRVGGPRFVEENFAGAEAAYKRLVSLADADNAGPVRRVARELTFLAREHVIGIACADLERHPDDFAIEMVKHVCMEENAR